MEQRDYNLLFRVVCGLLEMDDAVWTRMCRKIVIGIADIMMIGGAAFNT